jgi:hypothetical protein
MGTRRCPIQARSVGYLAAGARLRGAKEACRREAPIRWRAPASRWIWRCSRISGSSEVHGAAGVMVASLDQSGRPA